MRRWATGIAGALVLLFAGCASSPVLTPAGGAVAVWDLDDLTEASAPESGLGELLAGPVIAALQQRGYTVVERQRLLLLLEELRLGSTALADESTRLQLGRLSGARWMVFGGYQAYGGRLRVDLRVVDVETGKVLRAAQRTVASGDLPWQLEAARAVALDLVPGG